MDLNVYVNWNCLIYLSRLTYSTFADSYDGFLPSVAQAIRPDF